MPGDVPVEIQVTRTVEDYRRRRDPIVRVPPPKAPPALPPISPSLEDRVDELFERHGPATVHEADRFKRFALLPNADQRALLREADAGRFPLYLRHAREIVRRQMIEERGSKVPGQRP
jgi:hypothetical protein